MRKQTFVLSIIVIFMIFLTACNQNGNWYVESRSKTHFNESNEITQKSDYFYNENGQRLKIVESSRTLEYFYADNGQLSALSYNDVMFDFSFSKQNEQFVAKSRSDDFSNLTSIEVIYNDKNQLLSQKILHDQQLIISEEFSYHDNGVVKTWKYEEDGCIDFEKYDSRGNVLEYERFEDDVSCEKADFEYSDNMIVGSRITDKDGYIISETIETKDKNKIRTVTTHENGVVICYTEYLYDDYKNLIELSRYSSDNILYFQADYTWKESD